MKYIPIKELLADLTFDDLFDTFLDVAKKWRLPVDAWQTGEPARGLLSIVSDKFTEWWNDRVAPPLRSSFFDYAEGAWLRARAYSERGVLAQDETQAEGPVPIENRGVDFFPFKPGDVRIKNLNGYVYVNVSTATLPPWSGAGPYPTAVLTFRAETPGSEASTPIEGFEPYPTPAVSGGVDIYAGDGTGGTGPSATNTLPLVGLDAETDEQIKERARIAPGVFPLEGDAVTGPPTTRNAYEAIALDKRRNKLSTGAPVNISRVKVVTEPGGVVRVFLASPSGAASGDVVTPDTDVFVVNASIQTWAVPPGITCYVSSADARIVTGTFVLTVNRRRNVTAAEAIAAAKEAVIKYLGTIPIGGVKLLDGGPGYVLRGELRGKASEAREAIDAVSLSALGAGTDDLELAPNEVAVLDPSAVFSVNFVTQ